MFCPQCGKKNPDVASFCFNCGTTLSVPAPAGTPDGVSSSPTADTVYAPQTRTETTASKQCPVCGLFNPGIAERCDCGHDFNQATAADEEFPLFPVATHKFIVMSICTFSLYQVYWCYQNWLRLEIRNDRIRPLFRAIFAPLWGFALFSQIKDRVSNEGIPVAWSAGALAAVYLGLNALWRLPGPWSLLGHLAVVAMIPVQQAAQRLNDRSAVAERQNTSYTTMNVITIVIGGTLFVFSIVNALTRPGR
jgi:hypothetical protein